MIWKSFYGCSGCAGPPTDDLISQPRMHCGVCSGGRRQEEMLKSWWFEHFTAVISCEEEEEEEEQHSCFERKRTTSRGAKEKCVSESKV